MATRKLAAVRGMNDMLPADAPLWEWFEARVTDWLRSYGYQQIRTPIVEYTELFVKGIGEVTDIVEKEMYSFEDKLNGEHLTLRPEFTAGVIRAVVEHNLTYEAPRRLWSMGPVFRHERPQRGRYRQFHQVNVEAIGFAGPDIDAELIVMLARLWRILGIERVGRVRLEINCLGQADERARHRADLIGYFSKHDQALDADARRRLHTNPLRILDSKNPALADIIASCPAHHRLPRRCLARALRGPAGAAAGSGRRIHGQSPHGARPRLLQPDGVRVDHRCARRSGHTLRRRSLRPADRAHGRKADARHRLRTGNRTRDRTAARNRSRSTSSPATDVYVLHQGGATRTRAFLLAEQLRDAGLDVILHAGEASLKSQMKKADASGAEYAVIVGEQEAARGAAAVKALRAGASEAFAEQRIVPLDRIADALVEALSPNDNQ